MTNEQTEEISEGHKSKKKRKFDVAPSIQFHLLRLAAFHSETTKADLAVLSEIIQRYHGEHGNGWASHEHLCKMTGASKASVIRAKRNLERLGFIHVVEQGRRGHATVYLPNFSLVSQKGVKDDTETLGVTDDTLNGALGITDATKTPEYGIRDATPSYLHVPADKAGVHVSNEVSSPAAADGLAATARGEGFEDCFVAYGSLGTYHLALAEWIKIDFDRYPVAHIFERAASWNASAKPDQPRMPFEKWLAQKRYAEADRAVKTKAKKPKPTQQESNPPSPANDNEQAKKLVAIESKVVRDEDHTGWIKLKVVEVGRVANASKPDRWLEICYESADAGQQEQGQKELNSLCSAIGLDQVEDTDELLDKPFMFVDDQISETYKFYPVEREGKNAVSQIS